jgi:hypothetical protein
MSVLILKRPPIGSNLEDFDMLATVSLSAESSSRQQRQIAAFGFGRAAATATYAAPRTVTSRHVRPRWQRSRKRLGEGAG